MNKQELETAIDNLSKKAKLQGWNEFVEELKVPSELYPALITNRTELVRLAKPRPLTEEEAATLYRLIAGLMETNQALREHASQLSVMVKEWLGSVYGFVSVARKINSFAQFKHQDAQVDEEDLDEEQAGYEGWRKRVTKNG